jgi:selenide,water dikinase
MLNIAPLTRDLVLVGGGHAHALVLRQWGMNPLPGARLTVINPGPTAPYTGMLPGHVAGHYSRDTLEIDLVRLAQFAGARLILSHATGIDRTAKLVHVAGRGPMAYDVASVDIGITAQMDGIPGFAEHAVGAKPLNIYAQVWRDFRDAVKRGDKAPRIAVIGGGIAGCELAMAMAHALRDQGAEPEVSVIEAGPQISGTSAQGRAKLGRAMSDLGIHFVANARITRICEAQVLMEDTPPIDMDLCVGAAGAFPHDWIAQTDLPLHDGFIVIDPDLRVKGDDSLFAVGDCAHMPFAPRPKAGVFAVRAAPVLHDNLRGVLAGTPLRRFKPQKSYLKLVSMGDKVAMAEKHGIAISAPLLWRWKDRIDRAFMDKLSDLPVMEVASRAKIAAQGDDDSVDVPLCGGCGAKVGAAALKSGLGTADTLHADVVTGTGDDAAILCMPGGGFQVLSTDHLRAFIADPVQMTRIAAVHALGDVWAMGATPQAVLSTLILPRMSQRLQERTLHEINTAAREVFGRAGASIVGGHTTMGAEMTIGFTVTGTSAKMPITQAGAQAGDVLLLTRPIGSGVILAAHMAGKAPPRVLAEALARMEQPQDVAARILSEAHAMTDVTGFGLCGHVAAICAASGLGARIRADDVPVYDGARELSRAGIASSLLQANIADTPTVGISDALLHDPQTAGGLLAAMSPKAAQEALGELEAEGAQGWIIGEITADTGPLRIV